MRKGKAMILRFLRIAFVPIFSLFCAGAVIAAESPNAGTQAVVTALEGSAQVYIKGKTAGRQIKKGDKLGQEHEVRVGERSRMEIRFPDGTIMRLSEKSRLVMNELKYDKTTESKNVKVSLGVGKLWAKVKKLATSDSSVEVKTSNAVAGVRGTVYRVNVEEDKSALVKVYDGTVYVANPPREPGAEAGKATPPHEVSGPRTVPPPYHEVSMEEWTAIVKAMQQISISPEGKPSAPQDFDPKADADDWVKWNQERDKKVQL
jgi:hypothetical protein